MSNSLSQKDTVEAMSDVYDSLQPGDRVYFVERRKMALCQIRQINQDKTNPKWAQYVLDIVEQWYDHRHFELFPVFFSGKRIKVSRTEGIAYSGMWQFYTAQEFRNHFSHMPLSSNPSNIRRIGIEMALRRVVVVSFFTLIIFCPIICIITLINTIA